MVAKIKLIFLCVSLLIYFSCTDDKQKQNRLISEDLDNFFNSQIDTFNLSAISAAIVKENDVMWVGAYGLKNIETKEKVNSNTLFHQGSISKTITLAAFLHFWEKEKFNLDDDINSYLPFEIRNPYHNSASITFKMLLTHTSSFNDVNVSQKNNKLYRLYSNSDTPDALESTLRNILAENGEYFEKENFLNGKPGTEYTYSNVAYSLIGYLAEHISGIPFTDYCRQHIFKPLQMNKTTFLLSETDTANFAYQYYSEHTDPEAKIKIKPYTWPGYMDGSLRTTALEYSNFLIMLINRGRFKGIQVLPEIVIDTMLATYDLPGKQSTRMFQPAGRALIWNRVNAGEHIIYHFNGFGGGFFTEAYFDPKTKIAGLFFTTGGFSSFEILGHFTESMVTKMIECTDGL